MTRLCTLIVFKDHIQLLAKILQPAKCIDKEGNMTWKPAIGQVCPPCTNKRPGNQMLMIKVRHIDCQLKLCLCKKEQNQTSWKEFIARNSNGVLKSEIELLYTRWPLRTAVIAGYSQFSRRSNFGYYRFRLI